MIFLALSLFAASIHAQQAPSEAIELARSFHEAGVRCPDRVWPGLSLSRVPFLITRREAQQAWNFRFDLASVFDPALIQDVPWNLVEQLRGIGSRYAFLDWNGEEGLMLSLKSSDDFGLGFHESFHYFEQGRKNWPPAGADFLRGQYYPLSGTPRYYRAATINALRKAIELPLQENEFLAAARYWDDLYWATPDNHESMREQEIVEGSAQYAEVMGVTLAKLGCSASESELMTQLQSHTLSTYSADMDEFMEPYTIGALSGLLLRRRQIPNWQSEVMLGKRPLELLLGSIVPTPQAEEQVLRAQAGTAIAGIQARIDPGMNAALTALDSNQTIKLSINARPSGSMRVFSMYVLQGSRAGSHVTFEATGRFKSNTLDIALDKQTLISLSQGQNPCGDGKVVAVRRDEVSELNGTLTVLSAPIQGTSSNVTTPPLASDWRCLK